MIASIDIGTNSILLLIAEKHGDELCAIRQEARITRLGENLSKTDALSDAAMARTLIVLGEYAAFCRDAGVKEIIAIGTAAMRRAKNANEFSSRVERELGFNVKIISEDEEAILTYEASAASFGRNITVMDIGGGSTEFICPNSHDKTPSPLVGEGRNEGEKNHPLPTPLPSRERELIVQSLEIGVVTLAEQFFHADPISDKEFCSAREFIRSFLHDKLDPAFFVASSSKFIATAGTATTLAAMNMELDSFDPDRVHGSHLSARDIDALIEKIKTLPVAERLKLKGLQKGREDVILPGALIMREVMHLLGFDEATISDRGVRWGALYKQFEVRSQ